MERDDDRRILFAGNDTHAWGGLDIGLNSGAGINNGWSTIRSRSIHALDLGCLPDLFFFSFGPVAA